MLNNARLFVGLAAVMSLPFAGDRARAQVVVNGGFETSNLGTGVSPNDKKLFSAAAVTGWTLTPAPFNTLMFLDGPGTADDGNYMSVYGPFPMTSSGTTGGNFVMSDGDPIYSGTISQIISGFTPNQPYNVTFLQAAGQQTTYNGPTTEQWAVTLGATTLLSPLMSTPSHGVTPWQPVQLTFTPTSATQTLSFMAVGAPSGVPPVTFMDAVGIEAVPEPHAVMIVGIGLLGSVGVRRFRRSKSAATS